MTQADIIPITTRRNALRLGAAATVTAMVAPVIAIATPTGPDAALLDLCRRLDDDPRALHHYETRDMTGWTKADQHEADVLLFRVNDTIDGICAVPATTMAGIRAKAGALGHALKQGIIFDLDLSFDEQAEDYDRLAMSLVRDLAAVD